MAPVIRVVYDPYSTLVPGDAGLVVDTPLEFSEARRTIDAIKEGHLPAQLPWLIVVRREAYRSGFQDLMAWDRRLVDYRDASPRVVVESAVGISLPADITNERLLSWGFRCEEGIPAAWRGSRDLDAFLDIALENVSESSIWSRSAMMACTWLADWFCYLVMGNTEGVCADGYLSHVLENRVKQWAKVCKTEALTELTDFLWDEMSNGNGGAAARQIIVRSLLRQYGVGHLKWLVTNLPADLGGWIKQSFSSDAKKTLGQLSEQLYTTGILNSLVHKLDQIVVEALEDINAAEDLDQYVSGMSGFLISEYSSSAKRFCEMVVQGFESQRFDPKLFAASLDLIADRFAPLLANKTLLPEGYQTWLRDVLNLARVLRELQQARPTALSDWQTIAMLLMRSEALLAVVSKGGPDRLQETIYQLEHAFVNLNETLNAEYGDWLLAQFPRLLQEPAPPRLITQAAWLADEAPGEVIVLIVDGLRWDWWQHLANRLAEKGYQTGSEGSMGLAMLPTITGVSRRAAVGRFPLSNLIDFVDDVYGIDVDPDEEALIAARVLGYPDELHQIKPQGNKRIKYLPGKYVYVNGGIEDIQQALRLPAKRYVIIYPSIDKVAHTESEGSILIESVAHHLHQLADMLTQEIERQPHFHPSTLKLVVGSDHGCTNIRWSHQVSLPTTLRAYCDSTPQIERHGRVAQLLVPAGSSEADTLQQQLREFYQENSIHWHVIWGDEAASYGLPAHDKKGNRVLAWLSPRGLSYLAKGSGLYAHGGLSVYETIVPLALLSYCKGTRFIPPSVTFTGLDNLRNGVSTTVLVRIGNYNQQEMTSTLSLPGLQLDEVTLGPVMPGETTSAAVDLKPTKSGQIVLSISLYYRVGQSERMEWRTQVPVDVALSRQEQMQLETKRELF